MEEIIIGKIFESLRNSYQLVDFRAALFKRNDNWEYIIAIFRFTNKSESKIQEIHNELKKMTLDIPDLKFILKVIEKDEFEEKLEEIKYSTKNFEFKFENLEFEYELNLLNKSQSSSYLHDDDKKEYNSIIFTSQIKKGNIKHHERFQFLNDEVKLVGEDSIYPIIERILKVRNFTLNSPLFCSIIFPVYLNVRFESLKFVNNYLSGTIIYHNHFESSKVHIECFSKKDQTQKRVESVFIGPTPTNRSAIKKVKDNIYQQQFIVYFRDINIINETLSFFYIRVRFIYQKFKEFLIDFNIPLKHIFSDIEFKEKIPSSLEPLIFPFLKINLLDKTQSRIDATKIIENYFKTDVELLIKTININMSWLMDDKATQILEGFFISASNARNVNYFNFFKEIVIKVCLKVLQKENLTDIRTKSKFNDLLIKYCYFNSYSIKFYYFSNRLAEFKDEVIYLLDEIFQRRIQSYDSTRYDRRGLIQIDFPIFWSEIKVMVSDSLFCNIHFFRNDTSIFNYHTVDILFTLSTKPKKTWENVNNEEINYLVIFINKILEMPNLQLIDLNIPEEIISKLNQKEIIQDKSIFKQIEIRKENIFKIINTRKETNEKMFYDLNIFVGKNNSGKTFSMKNIFIDIINGNQTFDNIKAFNKFVDNYPEFPVYELFYIPQNRTLEQSIGISSDIKESLLNFFNIIKNLRSGKYASYESTDIEKRTEDTASDLWKIPNFLEIIDLFSLDLENISHFRPDDKKIVRFGRKLLETFNEIYRSWIHVINRFLPDVEIKNINPLGRRGETVIRIFDKMTQKEITNWRSFGSGTQQLLNLIFLFEFLKRCPLINYDNFSKGLESEDVELAFKENIVEHYNNRIIFVDEPEVSLHPSLQREFFEYLNECSGRLQIFIGTHSPFFLDMHNFDDLLNNTLLVRLYPKNETTQFEPIIIDRANKLRIIDEIFDYTLLEVVFYLSKNNYEDLMILEEERDFILTELNMIRTIIDKRKQVDPNFTGLLQLGTFDEDYKHRLIQNSIILAFKPSEINLNEKDHVFECDQFFLYQIHINKMKSTEKNRFKALCASCWDVEKCVKFNVLSFSRDQSKALMDKIKKKLGDFDKEQEKILKNRSILVFPENSLPYELINYLVEFAINNKIVIIGGMEHKTRDQVAYYVRNLRQKFPKKYIPPINLDEINSIPKFSSEIFINQAIVINANGKFSFQIKNVPFYKSEEKKENIPLIFNPLFFKFKTVIGSVAIMICKDFLVNYSVVDKWMDKNKINLVVIPSFSQLVNPFKNKFGNIIHHRRNVKKTFLFVNIAEYGGSGIYNFNKERDYEPGKKSPFEIREEECKMFIRFD